MFQWARLPDADGALTASSDTTETQIGAGLRVPNWAKSIIAVKTIHTLLALTTQEATSGYLRLNNDENTIEPYYLPLPLCVTLTGAIGTHIIEPLVVPTEIKITPNDILRAYSAFDAATTGVHTMTAYVCFSSREARFNTHIQKSNLQTLSQSAVTRPTVQTISTISGKTSQILGAWGYAIADITAAESQSAYALIESNAQGWLTQRIPLNYLGSGLSTQITPITKPAFAVNKELFNEQHMISGGQVEAFPDAFPCKTAENFNFYGMMDGANTVAPVGRFGLIWKE